MPCRPHVKFQLVHTHPDRAETTYPAVPEKADAARNVQQALVTAEVPLAGIAWRPIANGLMKSPTGESVLGIHGNHFTIIEVSVPPSPPVVGNFAVTIPAGGDDHA